MRKYLISIPLLSSALIYACSSSPTTDDGGTDATTDTTTTPDVISNDVANDTTPTDSSTSDVKDSGIPTCTASNPFSTPVILNSLNLVPDAGGQDRGGRLTIDYLTAYFQYADSLYSATRTSTSGDTFGTPTELSVSLGLPDAATQSTSPTLSGDALTLFFSSDRDGTFQIYVATRANTTSAFGAAALVSGLPTNAALTAPFLQGDGSTLWFLNAGAIYRAALTNNAVTGSPVAVTELNAGGGGPIAVTADGLTAYFSRAELPDGSVGGHQKVWMATRASTAAQFGNIVPVPTLNGPDGVNDDITWVSNDGCEVMLSSFRDPGSNLYIAVKP